MLLDSEDVTVSVLEPRSQWIGQPYDGGHGEGEGGSRWWSPLRG